MPSAAAQSPEPSPEPTPPKSPGPTPSPVPTDLGPAGCTPADVWPLPCKGQWATPAEEAAIVAVGRKGAEKELGLKDWSVCQDSRTSPTTRCFQVGDPSRAIVGFNAATFRGGDSCRVFCGGAACWVFLYKNVAGWHYLNARCAQAEGYVPGSNARVFVTGCANFRNRPSISAGVIGCLGNGTVVQVDSAPTYKDDHIWWHLENRGWMAHDFLVSPLNCKC